ncbi:MAG TPA: hypothetical protein VNT55_09975 [Baekduia sp.]|nr:hypothetical protein [Baekduia sp.]
MSGVLIDQPIDQLPVALGTVDDRHGVDETAAFIDQRGGVSLLVNVDSDDQRDLLARG